MTGNYDGPYTIISDSSCSDSTSVKCPSTKRPRNMTDIGRPEDTCSSGSDPGGLIMKAEMYQEYMRQIPIPRFRGSIIPFTSWQGLGSSMKQLYGQPLHYLTNLLLKRWDQQRVDAERLDFIIHPAKAEALVWASEEVHRLTCSPSHLAGVWASDSMYHAHIDPIFPDVPVGHI